MNSSPQLVTLVAAATFLFFKMLANTAVQAYSRFRGAGFRYPEDKLFGKPFEQENPYADLELRGASAWRNDLENIPLFLFAALLGLLTEIPAQPFAWLLGSYCFFRTVHTLCLVKGLQPWRTVSFTMAILMAAALFLWSLWLAVSSVS